jgi:DNA-binding transcriptional MerR regulator
MSEQPFISINELSKKLGVPAHTLRYWEKAFAGAIRPITGAGGRRYYREEDVVRIENIKGLLYDDGMTIAGVKKMLSENPHPSRMRMTPAPDAGAGKYAEQIDDALALLKKAKAELV